MLLLPPTMASLSTSLVVDRSSLREISKIHHHAWNRLLSIRWHILRPATTNVSKSKRRKAAAITAPTKSVKNLISSHGRIQRCRRFQNYCAGGVNRGRRYNVRRGSQRDQAVIPTPQFFSTMHLCQPARVPCNNRSMGMDPIMCYMFETCRIGTNF